MHTEIFRFGLVGFFVGATDAGLYYLLFQFLPFSLAKGISFICAGLVAYLFNKHWIFQCHCSKASGEAGRYIFVNFLALGLNLLTNHGILAVWPEAILPALIAASVATGVFVYIGYKWWVFLPMIGQSTSFTWWKWIPWKFFVRDAARRQGFPDPFKILFQLQNFMQPSEVPAPLELVRSGVVLHARGLMNSLAIQHNLDWVWPYWVECQYDPLNEAFIPRSFSLTQINLTHRNWTALGIPDSTEYPLVDPRGLVTPYFDSWSLDFWIIPGKGEPLIPSRLSGCSQKLIMDKGLCVVTESRFESLVLITQVQVLGGTQSPVCHILVEGRTDEDAKLVIALRPYNPEGLSLVYDIAILKGRIGWQVNQNSSLYWDIIPDQWAFSCYEHGDVYARLAFQEERNAVCCRVGMASAAVIYQLKAGQARKIALTVPLVENKGTRNNACVEDAQMARTAWAASLQGECLLKVPDEHFQFLYEAAIRTMILHSPREVYPGPYIYRRFWFRDAAFILKALLCAGLKDRVRRALDCFRDRQTLQGYFLSQEGEWDSNGEALWIMQQYCEMTGNAPPEEWKESINKAGRWICQKRLPDNLLSPHSGLLPSGFSAEHLGPNDFYYWDDYWCVAGLRSAAFLSAKYNDNNQASYFEIESRALMQSIDRSLESVAKRLNRPAIPASPYRRMDSGAIGSLAASYPLRIVESNDPRMSNTADYLMKNCLVSGAFFHDMTHSGINPYLSLHLAQVLLRSGNPEYFALMAAVAKFASPTGQWPESIHPRTGGGCMGDGQHVWAAAEWVLMIRNCFVREEGNGLILCSGVPRIWLDKNQTLAFGPAPTSFGDIHITISPLKRNSLVEWKGQWLQGKEPAIDIHFPGSKKERILPGTNLYELKYGAD